MPKRSDLNSSFAVQKEIMDLKSQLSEKESELIRLECSLMYSGPESTTSNSSAASEAEEWQSKYERLSEAHKKLQRTNMCLEEKLLKIVDRFEGEKNLINRDLATQTQKVVEAKLTIQQMHNQNTQLKSDLHVALNILQMKPHSFVSQKMDSLPEDLQSRVRQHNSGKIDKNQRNGGQKITVAVPNGAFENHDDDAVSAAILARVLEERENERKKEQKFCIDIGTQTHRWQFPDTLQLLKASRARNLLRGDDFSLLEELTLLSAAEKEFSNVRKQLLSDKGYLDDSDCISEEEDVDIDDAFGKDHLAYPKRHVSDILLASLMQPSPTSFLRSYQYQDNDINLKKEKALKSRETTFVDIEGPQAKESGVVSESESLKSFDLLGSETKLSNLCLEASSECGVNDFLTQDPQPQLELESIIPIQEENLYRRKQDQIYSSQPSSISSLLSLTQKAFTPNTLQRSFSTSSYSAVQTDM